MRIFLSGWLTHFRFWRSSARFTSLKTRKPPACRLEAFIVLGSLTMSLIPGPSWAEIPSRNTPAPKKLTPAERLNKAEKTLQDAQSDENAKRAWDQAEALRYRSLNHATRLLLDEAETQGKNGQIQAASEALNAAVTLQPDNALLRRSRAFLRLLGNDPTGAVQDLALSLKTDPEDPTAWALLAKAEESLHNNKAALTAFQTALIHAPYFPQGKEMLKHFQKNVHGQEN